MISPRRGGRRRYVLLVLILTAVTLITLDTRSDDEGPLGVVGRAAHTIVAPFEKAVDKVADPLNDWFEGLTDRGALKRENERLRRELEEMENEQRQARDAIRENEILEALNDLPILTQFDRVTARVINRSTGNFEWTITLSKGTDKRIAVHMPVLGTAGLVGKVIDSYDNGSKVRLLTDPDSNVSVRVEGGQVTGIAQGQVGEDLLRLELDSDADVEVGDDVLTSGLENSDFPAGLAVGEVVEIIEEPGIGKTALIDPWTDFDELELVQVLLWVPGQGEVIDPSATTTTTAAPVADPNAAAVTTVPPTVPSQGDDE